MIPVRAYIGLGSNLGDREGAIKAAWRELQGIPRIGPRRLSRIMEFPPVGPVAQPDYLNAVGELDAWCTARELLEAMLAIERRLGRDRRSGERWGPRTIDLDLLVFGNQRHDEPDLRVPHPRMGEREFVLAPLCDLAPDLAPPGARSSVRELLRGVRALGGRP